MNDNEMDKFLKIMSITNIDIGTVKDIWTVHIA